VLPPKSRRAAVICYAKIVGVRGLFALAQKSAQEGVKSRRNRRLRAGLALALLGTAAFTLAACGRAGPLEPPPGPAVVSPTVSAAPPSPLVGGPVAGAPVGHETAQRNGFDAYGNPVAPPGEKKSFFLDFLVQ
jgi:predicted small lipoprotein YifL